MIRTADLQRTPKPEMHKRPRNPVQRSPNVMSMEIWQRRHPSAQNCCLDGVHEQVGERTRLGMAEKEDELSTYIGRILEYGIDMTRFKDLNRR